MASRLHSVRRSLFEEFEEEQNDTSSANDKLSKHPSVIRVNINSTVVACIVIVAISVATLSNEIIRNLLKKSGQELLSIKARTSSDYIQMNYQEMLLPALYGTLMSIFTMFIVYFDSEVPGMSPLPPFSPRKANQIRYAVHLQKTNNLSYFVSLASGIITFFILYL